MKYLYLIFLMALSWHADAQDAKIQASATEGCIPLSVSFSYPAQGTSSYQWDFGNGITSTLAKPTVLFDAVGNYPVKLTLTPASGVAKTITMAGSIQVIDKPRADFDVPGNKFCNGEPITFSNMSTLADSYLWDFGDGNTSTEADPSHQYTRGGSYQVTLVAFNRFGCQGVKVVDAPLQIDQVTGLDFGADFTSRCIDNATVTFTAPQGYSSWQWDFGDGQQSSGRSVTHTYNSPGDYSISLAVENARGCTDTLTKPSYVQVFEPPALEIEFTKVPVCNGQQVAFVNRTKGTQSITWAFSDGFSDTGDSLVRVFPGPGVYSFTVSLDDRNGCTRQQVFTDAITVVEAPAPVIDISDTQGCVPFPVTFNNNTPGNPGYHWEIDGKNFFDRQVSYTFEQPGYYSVTAKTLHSSGCESTLAYDSVIVVYGSKIEIEASQYSGCLPLTPMFSLSHENVTEVQWDFGDGSTSAGLSPSHTYKQAGQYEVSVTLVNAYGCRQVIKLPKPINVNDSAIAYTASSPIKTCRSVNVYFNGGMGSDLWEWDFGDGNTSRAMDPVHTYDEPGTYLVSLTTNNRYGCRTTITNYNEIIVRDVEAGFSAAITDTTGCPQFTVQFENHSTGAERFLWDFGDGSQSTEANPVHEYEGTLQFPVVLTAWNDIGCSKRIPGVITSPWPSCLPDSTDLDLSGDTSNPYQDYTYELDLCSLPAEVTFRNPLAQAESWLWHFGDGDTSSVQNPVHTYTSEGTFFVKLVAFYEDDDVDTLHSYATINLHIPRIDFTYEMNATCDGTEVSFRNTSPGLLSWEWDLGNGNTSGYKDPIALYTRPGVYQVDLNAQDSVGCEVKLVKNVIIGNPYMLYEYNDQLCPGDSLVISHNIEGYKSFSWDLGDGNNNTNRYPVHRYTGKGAYQVRLNATDKNGCVTAFDLPTPVSVSKPIADFTIDGEAFGCNELATQFKNRSLNATEWQWDFGNGFTSELENPKHTFESGKYAVSLRATEGECSNTFTLPDAVVVDHLQANFEIDFDDSCLPQAVQFTDRSENAVAWLWDFGDGQQSTEQNPVHTYTDHPIGDITLEVKNNNGCVVTTTSTPFPFFRPEFEVESAAGCLPFEARFKSLTQRAVRWQWDFGDGNTSTVENPSHIYTSAGKFTVKLTAQSTSGCYDSLVKEEMITVNDVQASFQANVSPSTCVPLLVSFENASAGASKFHWDFGDNSSSQNADPFHIYTAIGKFDVTLVAADDLGCADTLTFNELVTTNGPGTQFSLSDSVLCHPSEISFEDGSASAIKWEWFFGDGTISDQQNPKHQYSQPGSYTVSLLATDDKGCQQLVKYEPVNVYPSPRAGFELGSYNHCLPVSLEVTNTSENLQESTYVWDLGNGQTSQEFQPGILYDRPGRYRLSLTTTNEAVCQDTYTFDQEIIVYDTTYQAQPHVQQLSVVDDKEIHLKYSPYPSNNFKYGLIYRQVNGTDFILADTIRSLNNELYKDLGVSPTERSYAYKLQSHVYCHEPADQGELTVYKSIRVSSTARENDILLQWTSYEGHSFDDYSILRKPTGGHFEEIARVPSRQTYFEDTEDLCPAYYTYQVRAIHLDGSEYHSLGNTTVSKPSRNIFLDQKVLVTRSTVENNSSVYTEWQAPVIGPDKVVYYGVWRSTGDADFQRIAEVPAGVTSYFDTNADVHKHNYRYKVEVINSCEVKAPGSNLGSTVHITKETEQYLNTLRWTPYTGWTQGVSQYLLQRMNEFGAWETVEVLEGDRTDSLVDLSREEN